jgi:hypothetical protein
VSRFGAIHPDAHIRLATAAKIAFPDGGMTVSGLRKEAVRGRLVIRRVAGKDFTTLREIEQMLAACVIEPKRSQSVPTRPAPSNKIALDSLLLSLKQPATAPSGGKSARAA